MFKVGDTVFYPMHGVGWVDAIEKRCVRGITDTYLVISFNSDGMKVLLPVGRAVAAGLRYLTPRAEAEEVFSMLDKYEDDEDFANWNRRYRFNLERMKKGDMESMALVARSLYSRNTGKGLSAGEKTMLKNAMRFLGDEYSSVTGKSPTAVAARFEAIYGRGLE